jgi:hypothetical protein
MKININLITKRCFAAKSDLNSAETKAKSMEISFIMVKTNRVYLSIVETEENE